MHTQEIIGTHPDVKGQTNQALIRAIEECYDCGQSCITCADACVGEQEVAHLKQCIRLNLDCADISFTAATISTRRTGSNEALIRSMLETCVIACRLSAEECQKHAQSYEHCRICADACRSCEQACQQAVQSFGPTH